MPETGCHSALTLMPAGVHDAIETMHLKTLLFGIAHDADGTQLMEVSLSC